MYCDKIAANRSKSVGQMENSGRNCKSGYDTVCFDKIVNNQTKSVGQAENSGITSRDANGMRHSRQFNGVAGNAGMINSGWTNCIPPEPLDTTYAVGFDVGPNYSTGNELCQQAGYFNGHNSTTSSQYKEEFECTINVGENFLHISGDSMGLVQIASILVNDFFNSDEFAIGLANNPDFIHNSSMIDDDTDGVGRTAFESHVPQPFLPPFGSNPFRNGFSTSDPQMAVNGTTNGPVIVISDSEDGHSTGDVQPGQPRRVFRSCRSHFSRGDTNNGIRQNNVNDKDGQIQGNGKRIVYAIQLLKLMSKSPISLSLPRDWDAVANRFPDIVRAEALMDVKNNNADGKQ